MIIDNYLKTLSEAIKQKHSYYFYISTKLFGVKYESPEDFKNTSSGTAIYNWLMEDAGLSYSPEKKNRNRPLDGDKNIWYLCLADKIGQIEYKNLTTGKKISWRWFRKIDIDKVSRVIDFMYYDRVFDYNQHKKLKDEIKIAKKIDLIENIPRYLGG